MLCICLLRLCPGFTKHTGFFRVTTYLNCSAFHILFCLIMFESKLSVARVSLEQSISSFTVVASSMNMISFSPSINIQSFLCFCICCMSVLHCNGWIEAKLQWSLSMLSFLNSLSLSLSLCRSPTQTCTHSLCNTEWTCHTLLSTREYTFPQSVILHLDVSFPLLSHRPPSHFLIFLSNTLWHICFNPLLHRTAVASLPLLSSSWSTRIRIPGNNIPTPSRPCFT